MPSADAHTLLLIPTYNERENVPGLVEQILGQDLDLDLLFIDDGSPDGTGEYLDRIAREEPRIQVLHRPEKGGLGSAYLSGFAK
ncbi:MAG: glycosyltransferase, partial [Kiritimatiellia bacterium]